MTISQNLLNALENNGMTAGDFNMTLEQITAASDGSSWKAQKGDVSVTLTKNSSESYTIETSK